MTNIPRADANIDEIWSYARKCSQKYGGFKEWWDWVEWGALQFKRYNESKALPDDVDDLQSFLALCEERSKISKEFATEETQLIPREIIKKLHNLNLD